MGAVGQRFDWRLVWAVALGLFAAWPFLARGGLPQQTDAELHVYRTAELNRIVQQGILYPRWAANLYLGYGYPIFNYYAPFTYHLGGLIARTIPMVDIVLGTKAVFVLGLVIASVGAYLLGREFFGSAGGQLAAAAFTLSPYVVFIDPHARGDLAEHFALCLLPLALYFLHRLLVNPSRGSLLGSVLTLATLVGSHNLLGLVASVLLFAYWVWSVLVDRQSRHGGWGLVAFALAAGLIAFFWLPALLEYDAVKLEVVGPGHFDYRQHFLSLSELLAPSRLIDWGAVGPRFRHNLGLVQWMLASAALAALVARVYRHRSRAPLVKAAFLAAGAAVLIFLMLSPSAWVWALFPAMAYLQFPWRLLGPANLLLAMCSASLGLWLPPSRIGQAVLLTVVGALLVSALPLLYPSPWPADFGGTEPIDILCWERSSHALGTTSTGDFLPTTVDVIPSVARTLLRSYEEDGPIDKINRATVPEGTEATILSHGPTHDEVHVITPRAFILRFYTFYFPGWTAYVDGQEVEIEIGRPEGFITIPVPAGEHVVAVRFEPTSARRLGWLVSLISLTALVGTLIALPGHRDRWHHVLMREPQESLGVTWVCALLLVVTLFKIGVLDRTGWLRHHSPPGHATVAQHTLHASFEGKIELLGFDQPSTTVRPGGTVKLVLYWRALRDIENNYQSFVHIAEPLDVVWTQEDHLNPGGLPTSRWPLDKYVWDTYAITVPADTPCGEYRVNVGLYSRADGHRLVRVTGEGKQLGDSLVIGSVKVAGGRCEGP